MARKTSTAKTYARSRERRRPQPGRRRSDARLSYSLPFQKGHYRLFGIGVLVILAGFIGLSFGSITSAPLLLVIGYCVLIPVIFIRNEQPEAERVVHDEASSRP